jgi:uncharacterized protein (TIGR00725 family)
MELHYDTATASLWGERGVFDVVRRDWRSGGDAVPPGGMTTLRSATEAVRRLSATRTLLPVGVIGGRQVTPEAYRTAEAIGHALATAGFPVMTGGKGGIMEAACKGAAAAGGMTIGMLPDNEWTGANPFVTLPIATGFGSARNAIIARACFALIAVGGEYGTQTEMAFGMHFGRLVLGFGDVPGVAGVTHCTDPHDAVERVAQRFLALDGGGIDASDDGER